MKLILVASLLLCLVVVSLQVAADNANQQTASDSSSPRSRFRLPKLIDFDSFKRMFNKHYTGILENLRRKKLFIARAFKAAISAIGYKHRERSSYLKINSMSDWTDDELTKLNVNTQPGSLQSELMSKIISKHETDLDDVIDISKVSGRSGNTVEESQQLRESPLKSSNLDDSEHQSVDLRKSHCLNAPKNQGACGSCYLFGSLALFEFKYCLQTGKQVQFSEQFLLDCGTSTGLEACNGGDPNGVGIFARRFGMMPSESYSPYEAAQGECKIGLDMEFYEKSWFKAENLKWVVVDVDQLNKVLAKHPVLSLLYSSAEFSHYGGGVHNMYDCDKFGYLHWILMVGYGVEDGREYWLFKNSYGTTWGEEGYYKLDKSVDCFFNRQHLAVEMKFKTPEM